MEELLPLPDSDRTLGRHFPWLGPGDNVKGAMWIGVPHVEDYWPDESGDAWIIQTRGMSESPNSCYLRLCPAPPDAEVQFGFCPLRVNFLPEKIKKHFPAGIEILSYLYIRSGGLDGCRVDRISVATMSLTQSENTTPDACMFRELLGNTPASDFLEDLLRFIRTDNEGYRNVLDDRDLVYRQMATLVVRRAYPGFLRPHDTTSFKVFKSLTGVVGEEWGDCYVWPWYYNVVMPKDLFESAGRSLKLGIPPLVPQYALCSSWMFNDMSSEPCTGLGGLDNITGIGRKLLAGAINRFNLDSPGRVSYWPFNVNPPAEWRARVIECATSIQNKRLPLDLTERGDLALSEARQIPVFFRLANEDAKFALLTKLEHSESGDMLEVETSLCDESGHLITEQTSEPVKENSSSVFACVDCDSTLDNDLGSFCDGCASNLCEACAKTHDYDACDEVTDNGS